MRGGTHKLLSLFGGGVTIDTTIGIVPDNQIFAPVLVWFFYRFLLVQAPLLPEHDSQLHFAH